MKRFLISAVPLLMVGQILNTSSILAMSMDDLGGEYWYMPETIAYEKEIEAAVAESCAGSPKFDICASNKRVRYIIDGGNREQVVWQLKNRSFTITSINPTRSTLRVHYTGLNSSSSSRKANVAELYIYWLEEGKVTPQLDWTKADFYTDKIKSGQTEDGMHVIFAKNEPQVEGAEWLKTGDEARIILPTGTLIDDLKRQIFYTMVNDHGDTYSGFYDYSACISSSDFGSGEGVECQGAFYIIDKTYTYLFKSMAEAEEDKELAFSPLTSSSEPEPTESINENLEEFGPPSEVGLEGGPISEEKPNRSDSSSSEEDREGKLNESLITSENLLRQEVNTPEDKETEPVAQNRGLLQEVIQENKLIEKADKKLNTPSIFGVQPLGKLAPNMLKSPDTGGIFSEDRDIDPAHVHLIAFLVLLSLLLIVWWFMPINKKKKQ